MRLVVLGGGAAGFFAAIAARETSTAHQLVILERTSDVLSKVRISGGGRCNVTHACFDPAELVRHYPRGGQALRGPFSRFQPRDTVAWFESHGVPLKVEPDRRIFPVSDKSESITGCLRSEADRLGVSVRVNAQVRAVHRPRGFELDLGADILQADRLLLATGSNPRGWEWARALGHTLVPPVPSLFTFQITDPRIEGLAGISLPHAEIILKGGRSPRRGPLLITHEGLSGPAVLRLSAWEARALNECSYRAALQINWIGETAPLLLERLLEKRQTHSGNLILADNLKDIPRRLWTRLARAAGIAELARWTEVSNQRLRALAGEITSGTYLIQGKSAFKEEFVTAGGVALDEVDFRTMQSKRCPGLYFAGEILDIDAETGGFNFQNAWTTGRIAGTAMASETAS